MTQLRSRSGSPTSDDSASWSEHDLFESNCLLGQAYEKVVASIERLERARENGNADASSSTGVAEVREKLRSMAAKIRRAQRIATAVIGSEFRVNCCGGANAAPQATPDLD